MRPLGTLANSKQATAPLLYVIVFDAATNTPQYALTQEPITEDNVGLCFLNGAAVYAYAELDNVEVQDQRPQGTGGITRRTVKLDLMLPDASVERPYARSPLSEALYSGGVNPKDFYFGIYVVDRANSFADLSGALFHGMFQLDVDSQWDEKAGVTQLQLIDMLVNDEYVAGAPTVAVPNVLAMYNPWLVDKIIPKVYGQIPRIRLVNSFGTTQQGTVFKRTSGTIRANFTDVSTELVLEDNVSSASQLLPMVGIVGKVKIVLGYNGECVTGTLTYDAVGNKIKLTSLTRNDYYTVIYPHTRTIPEEYENFGELTTDGFPTFWDYNALVVSFQDAGQYDDFTQLRERLGFGGTLGNPSPLGGPDVTGNHNFFKPAFIQFDAHFYDAGSPNNERTISKTIQLRSSSYFANTVHGYTYSLTHDTIHDATYGDTTVTSRWSSTTYDRSAYGSHTETHLNHLWFAPQAPQAKLFFTDPAAAASSGLAADNITWDIVAFGNSDIDELSAYIQNGWSKFDNAHLYYEGRDGLVAIQAADVVSITDGVSAFGYDGMTRVTLTKRPQELYHDAKSNVIYADAQYPTGAATDSRTEIVISKVLADSPALAPYVGNTLKAAYIPAPNILPYIGVMATGESVGALLDRICEQCGVNLVWRSSGIELSYSAVPGNVRTSLLTISGQDYVRPIGEIIDADDALFDSCKLHLGKLLGKADAYGYEIGSVLVRGSYGGWEDPKFPKAQIGVPFSSRVVDREVNPTFDYINDRISFFYALGLYLAAGHSSGVAEQMRDMTLRFRLQAARFEALDCIVLKNFPGVTDDNTNNPILHLDTDGYPLYKRHPDDAWFYMGGFGVVEQVTYSYGINSNTVELVIQQASPYIPSLSYDMAGAPWPPNQPPVLSPPGSPPDGNLAGGNSGGGMNPGGPSGGPINPGGPGGGSTDDEPADGWPWQLNTPMTLNVGTPAPIIVKSTDTWTQAELISVNSWRGALGITWRAALATSDHTGIALSGDTEGMSSDKTSGAWVPEGPWVLGLGCDYTAFRERGNVTIFTYPVTITRRYPLNPQKSAYAEAVEWTIYVTCALQELIDLVVS